VWINRKKNCEKKNRENVGVEILAPGIKEQILQVILYKIDALFSPIKTKM